MRLSYRGWLILLGVVAAIMSAKDVATVTLMLTLGLGIPLLFAGTAFLYLACFLPLALVWKEGWLKRAAGAAASILIVLVVAQVPHWRGAGVAESIVASATVRDFSPTQKVAPATLEIRKPSGGYDSLSSGEPCGVECKTLLIRGAVKWARTTQIASDGAAKSSTVHALRNAPECMTTGSSTPDAERCVVMVGDPGGAADLLVDIGSPTFAKPQSQSSGFASLESTRAVTAAFQGKEILRRTEVSVQIVAAPLSIGPKFSGLSSEGMEIVRTATNFNEIKLSDIFAAVGLPIVDLPGQSIAKVRPHRWDDGLDDGMNVRLAALLDLPQTEPFNNEQAKIARDWLSSARVVKTWTPDLMSLLRRVVYDRRLTGPNEFNQIFERNRVVTQAFLPDVLQLLDQNGIGKDFTPERQAAYTFMRLDPSLLQPHAAAILALMSKNAELHDILLPSVGRLGADPLPHLLPFRADIDQPRSRFAQEFSRLRAACLSEPQWAPTLIPAVRQILEPDERTNGKFQSFVTAALKTLVVLGDTQFVENELQSRQNIDVKRIRIQIKAASDPHQGLASLCAFSR